MVEIVRDVPESEWKRFMDGCDKATIYHTPEWKRFLEKTFGYSPHYLFAIDENGELVGQLPLFHVKSGLTGNRLCCVPFSHVCECLGNQKTRNALIDRAIEIRQHLHIDRLEIRGSVLHEGFLGRQDFCTHVLDLFPEPATTWHQLDKGSARWAVTKSKKLGVTVTTSTDSNDLKEFFELNCLTKQHLGVPCHPKIFFENLFSLMGDNLRLYLSRQENRIIAGGVMVNYKDKVLYGYGAADPDSLHLHPYNAFIWQSIEDACIQGFRSFDFGRTSYANPGLIQFKKKWGTQERELQYSIFPHSSRLPSQNRESSIYRLGNAVIRSLPMRVYSKFSEAVFSHFG